MRVAFSPDGAHLLTVAKGDAGEVIRVWHVAFAQLGESQLAQDSISYRNAKVVMVGDTGVGKSGLGMVLAGEKFQPTDSTHGRRVWSFEPTDVSVGPGHRQRREIVLWDLAGQPGYRLVHKLNIDQATVALVLVDARSETDPLGVAEYWARGIAQTHSAVPITKFLVVARIDRGGLAVSAEELECFARQHDFAGVFQTSAKTGEGVLKLAEAIRGAIRWEELEEVGSNQLFVSIRQFLQKQKALGDKALVERVDDLFKRCAESSDQRLRKATLPDFRTCVGRLEAAGFVEILKFRAFKAGEDEAEFVLLQSEYIDAYASALLLAARKDDPRGLGHLLESDVVAGNLGLPEEERIAHREHERRVLAVAVERLLAHEIALRERIEEGGPEDGDYLVFPSEYTRQAPYPRRNAPGIAFDFEGATRSIFTTLVVRLAHHREFTKTEFFRDAACYEAKAGGRCAVVLDERQRAPGQGSMSVYFEDNPSLNEQHAFLRFVRRHLEAQAKPGSIEAHRLHFCRACGYAWEEALIEKRLRLGKADIVCPNCDERTPLFDLMMVEEDKACEGARQMDADADAMRRKELAAAAIEGKTRLGEYDVFLSYNTKDRAQVVILADGLRSIGIRPWLDVWDLVPGRPWQKGLHRAITRVKSAVVCVGVSGIGPWQDHEVAAFIRKFVKRDSAVIPALLPGARKQPKLPIFLESFRWVDLRDFRPDNTRPLANLVAGILGRRPGEMVPDQLVEQVASVLNIPTAAKKSLRGSQQIVLPVDLPVLSGIELEAIRQQIAQLLGIPSQQLEFVGIRRGSVILRVPDLKAANRLFAMFERNDPALRKLFRDWQISPDDFQNDNLAAPQTVRKAIASRKAKAEAEKASVSITRDEKKALKQWTAGATVLPVAVVFTDIVDSAKLCNDLGETPWGRIREDHFARAVSLTRQRDGFLVKNTGDGVLALFRNAHNAVNFARSLYDETGHAAVRIRVGVHSGEVNFDDNALWGRGDAWGQNLNFTARVMSHAKGDGIRVSDEVKRDLDRRRDPDGPKVRWVEYSKVKLKSFKGSFTLWGMEAA
jgi:small GTP-binding protein